jgi:leucyl aminopeptidase (aminopeptidase T)
MTRFTTPDSARKRTGAAGFQTLAALTLLFAGVLFPAKAQKLDHQSMAERIVNALDLQPGERVLLRHDPGYFAEIVVPLRRLIKEKGAIDLGVLEYVELSALNPPPAAEAAQATTEAFSKLLDSVDVYIWLPVRTDVRTTPPAEAQALARWLDEGGTHRQVHFHWSQGSVLADGLAGEHSAPLDRLYQEALDVDYQAMAEAQDRAIVLLRSGTVRVRTPAGTDLRFRIGTRPFNKQDGVASPARMKEARIRIDRETELPAGVLRVAPLEETVRGRLVVPKARLQGKTARNIQLAIEEGRVTQVTAGENLAAVEAEFKAGGDAARRFREFGLGFNPKLETLAGSEVLPYFGYGAGVVRMSLGDNEELGGDVRGGYRRWFFFPDATVEVDGETLVRDGKLLSPAAR